MQDRAKLLRYTCHVGAWVALLPLDAAAEAGGLSGLSPVSLLAMLLRQRGKGSLTPWLQEILQLVRAQLNGVGATPWAETLTSQAKEHWDGLGKIMPGSTVTHSGPMRELPSPLDVQSPRVHSKRLRLLDRAIMRWDMNSDKECYVSSLEYALDSISGDTDQDAGTLREVLRGAVASLAHPRAKPESGTSHEIMDGPTADNLKRSAALQLRIRRVVIKSIIAWREQWADDEQIEPMLEHVRRLIANFKLRLGNLCYASAGKAWSQVMDLVRPSEGQVEGLGTERHRVTPRAVAKLKHAVLLAMNALGGEASSLQLITRMRSDSGIWDSIKANVNRQSSHSTGRMKNRTLECWEANVINNVKRYCIDSQRKTPDGLRIWRLETSLKV